MLASARLDGQVCEEGSGVHASRLLPLDVENRENWGRPRPIVRARNGATDSADVSQPNRLHDGQPCVRAIEKGRLCLSGVAGCDGSVERVARMVGGTPLISRVLVEVPVDATLVLLKVLVVYVRFLIS